MSNISLIISNSFTIFSPIFKEKKIIFIFYLPTFSNTGSANFSFFRMIPMTTYVKSIQHFCPIKILFLYSFFILTFIQFERETERIEYYIRLLFLCLILHMGGTALYSRVQMNPLTSKKIIIYIYNLLV